MSLRNSYFIVGTDTDIGKTYVSALLYKGLKKIGCSYFKPVQSGGNGGLAPDVDFLCRFNGIPYDKNMECFVLEEPLSPHLAAEKEGTEIDPSLIKARIMKNSEKFRYNIIEGAGGIFVPIVRGEYSLYDLIQESGCEVILTASTKVGTINHTMLTLEFLKQKGIPVKGIIFNRYSGNFYEDDNIRVIREMSGVQNILVVPEGADELSEQELTDFINR